MPKPKSVRLTNPQTCQIVARLTKDPAHFEQCPIEMTREKWDSIKHYVKSRKEQAAANGKVNQSVIRDVFEDFFGTIIGGK